MFHKTRILILLMLILLTAVACADAEGEPEVAAPAPTSVPEQVEAPADESAEVAEEVAAPTDTAVPTEEAVAEAPATEEPTAVPAPAEPAADRFGILRFRDSDTTNSGNFQLLLEGLASPPVGAHYELWLVDDSFNTLNLGAFEVTDGNVQFSGNVEQNLLASYGGAFISLEPDGVDDGEIGTIAFNGTIPAGSLLHIRHIVTAFPANPESNAFLVGAQSQLALAMEHAGFLLDELANDNIREAQRHAEHVINILDGETGTTFGDLDGDTVAQNPGDGFGVRAYLEGAKEHTNLALGAEGVTAEVQLHAEHVLISSDNALGRIDAAIAEALRVIASDSAAEAQGAAETLAGLLDAALNGVDANGDGNIAPIADEGGVTTAYVHGQNMASLEFFAADGFNAAAPAPADDVVVVSEAPPAPTEAPAEGPAAVAPVTIEMVNFAFVPNNITVPVGTAVTWANKDSGPRHSATAADGSFDTGLFDSGEESTITFDKPGTYLYYCALHGSPDGSGMTATITVTDQ